MTYWGRMPTELAIRRAKMYASGMTLSEVAEAEGVIGTSIRSQLNRTVYLASRIAVGDVLPRGLAWTTDTHGERYAWHRRSRVATNEQVRWALAILDDPDALTCKCCGRPL